METLRKLTLALAVPFLLCLSGSPGGAVPSFRAAGLQGEYWGPGATIPASPGVPAGAPSLTHVDTTVDYGDAGWPVPYSSGGVSADNFVLRWTGWVLRPTTGTV